MKRLALALTLVSALPFTAAAKDAFKNLPGVKDPDGKDEVQLDMDCTSRLVRRWPSQFPERNGLAYRVYSCKDGQVAVGSSRPPNLIEYRKFKERYQP
jgi:hypothetical protein